MKPLKKCKRSSKVGRYSKAFNECFPLKYVGGDKGNEDKSEYMTLRTVNNKDIQFKPKKFQTWGLYDKKSTIN